jgi:hypothetical protein
LEYINYRGSKIKWKVLFQPYRLSSAPDNFECFYGIGVYSLGQGEGLYQASAPQNILEKIKIEERRGNSKY